MKKSSSIIAFIIIGIAGTLSHFIYEWSDENPVARIFFPANESIFGHLKLLFFPALVYFTAEYLLLKEKPDNYIFAAASGIFSGTAAIAVIFYTYTGILGYHISFIDISIFFIALIIMLYVKALIIKKGIFSSAAASVISIIFIVLTAVLFGIWSFNPPAFGLFTPPTV